MIYVALVGKIGEESNASDIRFKKAQEKENTDNERYRQQEDRQRVEQFRRDDLDQEKGIWNDTLQARIG